MYGLKTEIKFGKYKGKTIEWIIKNDIYYIDWVLREIKGFQLDPDAEFVYKCTFDNLGRFDEPCYL